MDKAQSLLSLARLCENPIPSGNINCAIFATLHPERFSDEASAAQYARPDWTRNGADWLWLRDVGMLQYTESVDAAMLLVPQGFFTLMATEDRHSHSWRWDLRGGFGANVNARAATPALALCAAALRAIAAEACNA